MPKRKPKDLVSDAQEVTTELSVAKATRAAAAWRHKYKDAVGAAIELEGQLETLLAIQERPRQRAIRLQSRQNSKRGVAVIVPATDWHVEERIFREATNGKNHFDLTEAEARVKRFYQKIAELIAWQNHYATVRELWHPLLGDLLTGYIHEELVETNTLSPTEACVFLQEMICSGIDFLRKETKLPIFIPTCVGNHGRTTIKKRIKTSVKNSYEWLTYKTLAKFYEHDPKVCFMIGSGYHNTQEIVGRKVRFHHGDGLRYNGGVGGITIPVNKSIAQWDKVETVDLDIFGHWHSFMAHYPKWISCGSLMGYSEYSVEIKAEFQHPTQTFIVIDREYGLTSALPIFLTKPKRRATNK